jgi:hypothetical protein
MTTLDSQRFFDAGADVIARDPEQSFLRLRRGDGEDLAELLARAQRDYDVTRSGDIARVRIPVAFPVYRLPGRTYRGAARKPGLVAAQR